ncbi:hypothetical protein GCM10016272_01480 [Psychrobacter glaciei]|uniref:KilA-N DNA-binding domain-containing protein n=1 Tax=Psychrobacter glaciei TaxID=619771 RepID=A0ABQ3GM57_9GAMM|nr:hypothetical protein [Psychrobacter glaciei]GHD25546.1 hypothetical protein GCM10016272_01480 [Psychrobacter glaciei]
MNKYSTANSNECSEVKKLPIKRYMLAGRRRVVLYNKDLANISNLSESKINTLHKKSQLRKGQDWVFNPDKSDFVLSLSSAQAIMVIADTDKSWEIHHRISDFIQQGFKK